MVKKAVKGQRSYLTEADYERRFMREAERKAADQGLEFYDWEEDLNTGEMALRAVDQDDRVWSWDQDKGEFVKVKCGECGSDVRVARED